MITVDAAEICQSTMKYTTNCLVIAFSHVSGTYHADGVGNRNNLEAEDGSIFFTKSNKRLKKLEVGVYQLINIKVQSAQHSYIESCQLRFLDSPHNSYDQPTVKVGSFTSTNRGSRV